MRWKKVAGGYEFLRRVEVRAGQKVARARQVGEDLILRDRFLVAIGERTPATLPAVHGVWCAVCARCTNLPKWRPLFLLSIRKNPAAAAAAAGSDKILMSLVNDCAKKKRSF